MMRYKVVSFVRDIFVSLHDGQYHESCTEILIYHVLRVINALYYLI